MRSHRNLAVLAVLALVALLAPGGVPATAASAPAVDRPLRILVTNDDGVGAAGIDVLVNRLRALPSVQVTVIAPAANQSGTGDRFTTTPITVSTATTASGVAARSVNGFPADTVLFGILGGTIPRPDLVVSGINQGQNLGAEIVPASGTVGAALWAARLNVPAIAVSQGLAATFNYTYAANRAADLVSFFRRALLDRNPQSPVKVLNLNVPSCATGAPRGLAIVPVGRLTRVTGYTGGSGATGTFTPTTVARDFNLQNCASTLTGPVDDVQAFNNGFAPLSVLQPDQNADPASGPQGVAAFAG
jgi:5'-nucleotidase